jgi:hypothetical protein
MTVAIESSILDRGADVVGVWSTDGPGTTDRLLHCGVACLVGTHCLDGLEKILGRSGWPCTDCVEFIPVGRADLRAFSGVPRTAKVG